MEFDGMVLSGGGIHGISFIGSIQYMEESCMLKKCKQFVGTSIGSVICFLIVLDIRVCEMMNILEEYELLSKKDIKLANIFTKYSIDSVNRIKNIIEKKLNEKNININITFEELYKYSKKELIVTGTNLTDKCIEYFDVKTTPQMKIMDAILISISIPFIYEPYVYNDKCYVDGGLLDNFPIHKLDNENKMNIGITTKTKLVTSGLIGYILNIIETIRNYTHKNNDTCYIIEIQNNDIPLISYDYKNKIQRLYNNGYEQTTKYFKDIKEKKSLNENVKIN